MFWNKKKEKTVVGAGEGGTKISENNNEATARAQKCAEAINVVLMKYRCFFNPVVMFSGQGGFTSTVKIIPILDEKIEDPTLAELIKKDFNPKLDN